MNDIVRTDANGKVCKQVDFRNNKYLSKMFTSSEDFKSPYNQLLTILNQSPNKTVRDVLLELPQNKATKVQFEKSGINFDRWTKFDPKSKLQINITDEDKQNDIINNLEEILTSPILGILSIDKQEKLIEEINLLKNIINKKDEELIKYKNNNFCFNILIYKFQILIVLHVSKHNCLFQVYI